MAANSCTRCIIVGFSIFLIVIFLGITIVGIIGLSVLKSDALLSVGFIVVGGAGGIIAVFGLFGGQFNYDRKPRFPCCLYLFYILMIVCAFAFLIIGVCCLCLRPTVQYLLTLNTDTLKEILPGLSEQEYAEIGDYVDSTNTICIILGVFCLVSSAAALVVIITSTFHMGTENFKKFYIVTGSLILLILGMIVAVVGMVCLDQNYHGDLDSTKATFICIVVLGGLMVFISFLGFTSTCCCDNRNKPLLCVFVFTILTIAVGFAVVAFVCFFLKGGINSEVNDFLAERNITEMAQNIQKQRCGNIIDETEKNYCISQNGEKKVKQIVKDLFNGFVNLLIVVCIVFVFILIVVIVAACMAMRPEDTYDRLSVDMPDYREKIDITY